MNTPQPELVALAKHVVSTFGGECRFLRHKHELLELCIDVACCRTTERYVFSTVGLSLWMKKYLTIQDERFEFGMLAQTKDMRTSYVLAAAAFRVMQTAESYTAGMCFENFVREFIPETTVPHLYFSASEFWLPVTPPPSFEGMNWLVAFGISELENAYLRTSGPLELESRLALANVDVSSTIRESTVQ